MVRNHLLMHNLMILEQEIFNIVRVTSYGKIITLFQGDTRRKNAFTYKTQVITKSINMEIWVIGKLNQLFLRNSYTEINFSKK